jgi:hypothetical protein
MGFGGLCSEGRKVGDDGIYTSERVRMGYKYCKGNVEDLKIFLKMLKK